ncbi:hypothetical protein [Nocardia sp. NPDC005366]|uniref:hypothetical protein n=1 Tax=Nocardia sp. NPDC005366 TaxID=3156878 RepID=UPI0033B98AE1
MAQRISIESTDRLRLGAEGLDRVHAAVNDALDTLVHTLTGRGDPISAQPTDNAAVVVGSVSADQPPWGTDSYGRTFASGADGYATMSVELLQGGFDMARTLAEFARGMRRAAGGLDNTEESSITAFT